MSIKSRLNMLEAEGYEPAYYQGKYYDMGWLGQEDTIIFWASVGDGGEYDYRKELVRWYQRIQEDSRPIYGGDITCGSFEEELKKAFNSILERENEIDPHEIKRLELGELRNKLKNDLEDFWHEDIDLLTDRELGGWVI
tara:strand:- start:53 stop:469 length:417 start_codon:yes stop_codon:yes gene_type:complete